MEYSKFNRSVFVKEWRGKKELVVNYNDIFTNSDQQTKISISLSKYLDMPKATVEDFRFFSIYELGIIQHAKQSSYFAVGKTPINVFALSKEFATKCNTTDHLYDIEEASKKHLAENEKEKLKEVKLELATIISDDTKAKCKRVHGIDPESK